MKSLLLLLLVTAFAGAATVQEQVDGIAARYGFTGAIAVEKGGRTIAAGGYGTANPQTGEKNSAATRFRLASVSKQFTAVGILMLEEQGLLSIDETLGKYLPDWPADKKQLTLRQILNHSSGLVDYTQLGADDTQPIAVEDLMQLFRDRPLQFSPGSQFSYCNSNYSLMGYLIEKLSGMTYEQFVQQRIFGYLEMWSSGFDWPRTPGAGFSRGDGGFVHSSFAYAAGALYASAADMTRWFHSLSKGEVVGPASLAKLGTPGLNGYSLGLAVGNYHGHRRWTHDGVIPGFHDQVHIFPDDDIGVAVLSNEGGSSVRSIADEIAALVL